ncbi:MAG: 30S ribosome-binding factor RbfA [Myxococcota bacterium]
MSGAGNPRKARVAQAMRDVLARMLDREVRDPRVHAAGLASVNHVELNRDMSVARVYVSFIGPADDDPALGKRAIAALQAASGFLRGPLGRELRLRYAPELRFVGDDSPAMSQRLTRLMRDEQARAAADAGDSTDTDRAEDETTGQTARERDVTARERDVDTDSESGQDDHRRTQEPR